MISLMLICHEKLTRSLLKFFKVVSRRSVLFCFASDVDEQVVPSVRTTAERKNSENARSLITRIGVFSAERFRDESSVFRENRRKKRNDVPSEFVRLRARKVFCVF